MKPPLPIFVRHRPSSLSSSRTIGCTRMCAQFVTMPMEREWHWWRVTCIVVLGGIGGNLWAALLRPFRDMRAMAGAQISVAASAPVAAVVGR